MRIKQILGTIFISTFLFSGLFMSTPTFADCGGATTNIISCNKSGNELKQNGVFALLLLAINILTAGIGILAVGGIVYGSILYTSATSNSDQVKKAINVITNVVIGVVAWALAYSFLNYIIPGGLF